MKDGGPAFPRPGFSATESDSQEGMSLRDWFAGQAIVGLLAAEAEGFSYDGKMDSAAKQAYQTADAMLAERVKEKGTP